MQATKYLIRSYENDTGDRLNDFRRYVNDAIRGGGNVPSRSSNTQRSRDIAIIIDYLKNHIHHKKELQIMKTQMGLPFNKLLPEEEGPGSIRFSSWEEVREFLQMHPMTPEMQQLLASNSLHSDHHREVSPVDDQSKEDSTPASLDRDEEQ